MIHASFYTETPDGVERGMPLKFECVQSPVYLAVLGDVSLHISYGGSFWVGTLSESHEGVPTCIFTLPVSKQLPWGEEHFHTLVPTLKKLEAQLLEVQETTPSFPPEYIEWRRSLLNFLDIDIRLEKDVMTIRKNTDWMLQCPAVYDNELMGLFPQIIQSAWNTVRSALWGIPEETRTSAFARLERDLF